MAFRRSRASEDRKYFRAVRFFGILAIVYLGWYFLFPALGLVDIRALPQVYLCVALLGGVSCGALLRAWGRIVTVVVTPLLVCLTVWWVEARCEHYRHGLSGTIAGGLPRSCIRIWWRCREYFAEIFLNPASCTNTVPYITARGPYEHSRCCRTLQSGRPLRVRLCRQRFGSSGFYLASVRQCTTELPVSGDSLPEDRPFRAEAVLDLMGVGDLILVSERLIKEAKRSRVFSYQRGPLDCGIYLLPKRSRRWSRFLRSRQR